MTRPVVSIIVPVYNAAAYVAECLQSLIAQTYPALEIIVIDDGSTDNSYAMCQSLCSTSNRIRLYHQANAGVSAARNAGIAKSTGDYIMFVDADDALRDATTVETLLQAYTSQHDVLIYKKYHAHHTDTRKTITCPVRKIAWRLVMRETLNAPWNKVYRAEIIKQHSVDFPVGVKIGEDLMFNIAYFRHVQMVAMIDYGGYVYREDNIHSATKNLSATVGRDLARARKKLLCWAMQQRSLSLGIAYGYIALKNTRVTILQWWRRTKHKGGSA